jgi:hypothetical protein
LETESVRSLIKTTAFYAVVIGGLLYLQYYQRITIPVKLEGATIDVDPTFLLLPLLSLVTCNYASKVINAVVAGKLGEPLSSGANRLGVASFIWLLTLDPEFPPYLQPLGSFILFVAVVSVARSLVSTILMEKNQVVGETVTTSMAIALMGVLTSRFWQQINVLLEEYGVFALDSLVGRTPEEVLLGLFYKGLSGVLDESILMSASFVAVIALTGVLRYHPNPYLDFVGRKVGTGLTGKFMVALGLLVYVLFLREFILVYSGINPQLVTLGEWGLICLASYITYRRTRSFVSESLTSSGEVGYWSRHIQEIEHKSHYKLDKLSGLVEGFIRSGERDELIVYMVDVFRRFNVPVASISRSVAELINHEEIEIGLTTFSWQRRMLERMNLERRREALGTVMGKLDELALQMSYRTRSAIESNNSQSLTEQEVSRNED